MYSGDDKIDGDMIIAMIWNDESDVACLLYGVHISGGPVCV